MRFTVIVYINIMCSVPVDPSTNIIVTHPVALSTEPGISSLGLTVFLVGG